MKEARLKFGPKVSLIDLSAGGVLFDVERPVRPGALAAFELIAEDEGRTVAGRVLRCEVTSVNADFITYRGACAFIRPLAWTNRWLPRDPIVAIPIAGQEAEAEEPLSSRLSPVVFPSGWSEVLLAFRHGRFLKGFTRGFHPDRPTVDVWPSRRASDTGRQTVPVALLRTVLFLRDLDEFGRPIPPGRRDIYPCLRKVEVIFKDNHLIVGMTPDDLRGKNGFVLLPPEPQTYMRVFAVASAVREVRFL